MATDETRRPDFPNEAEAVVLAYALGGKAELAEVLKYGMVAEAFYVPARRILFAEAVRQLEEAQGFDMLSLTDGLDRAGQLEAVGGYAGLTDAFTYHLDIVLTKGEDAAELRRRRVQEVLDARCRREAAVAVRYALERLEGGDTSATQAILTAVGAVAKRQQGAFRSFRTVHLQVMDELQQELNARTYITGIRSGYFHLDALTAGFQPGNVYVVAARPSMGKTCLGLNLVQNMLLRPHDPAKLPYIAVVTAEMSASGLYRRMLASESGCDLRRVVQRGTGEDFANLRKAAKRLVEASKHMDFIEAQGMDIDRLSTLIRMQNAERHIDLLLVDYLQLIPGTSERASLSTVDAVAEVSNKLHALAVSLCLPVVALAQLNRDATGKSPTLRDIKGSGSIEQDADVVILIDRPEKYLGEDASPQEREDWRGLTILDVAKNRNGETGRVLLDFDGSIQRFQDRADQHLPVSRTKAKKTTFRFSNQK